MARKTALEIVLGFNDTKLGKGLRKVGSGLKKFRLNVKKAFASAPVKAFRLAVIGVGAALIGSVVEAAKFNVQMARVWTMAGGGIQTFRDLREETRQLASEFGLARSEIGKGMYNALSAGIDKANLSGFMTHAAKVAVADGSDISVAVDGITTVLNAFKIKSEETEKVTDQLFQTVAMGKTTFSDLASSLSTVAPMAAASNIPLKQILAHVAALTAQGTPTAQAMTQIRASIQGLNKALGDGWSDTMSYQDALKEVWSLAGESQTELLKLVGSTEAVQAVLGGVGINAELASEKLQGMADSAGAAQTAFDKVDQFRHWPTLIETARGALSKFGEEVDQRIAPVVERVTEAIRQWRDDPEVWGGVTKFLDNADSKVREIADMVKSPEDLITLGKTIGEQFSAYVITKGAEIGKVIGDGIVNAIPGAKSVKEIGGFAGDQLDDFLNLISLGKFGKMEANQEAKMVEISEASQQTLAEAFATNLAAKVAEKQQPADNATRLAEIFEQGLSGADLDAAIAGLELTAEEYQSVVEYVEQFSEAAATAIEANTKALKETRKTAEAATKSADATVDAQSKVTDAMTRAGDASVKTAQAAVAAQQQAEQAIALVQQLAPKVDQTAQRVSDAESQIRNMRA